MIVEKVDQEAKPSTACRIPALSVLVCSIFFSALSIFAQPEWMPMGPAPITGGAVENVRPLNEVNGAINAVQTHPTNADVIYVGGVNSGVWKTSNAAAPRPTWVHLSASFPSLSATELNLDPTDPTLSTLVVGIGRRSSFGQAGGERTGLLRTTNDGTSWTELTELRGSNISGVASRGSVVIAAADDADTGFPTGLFRSTDRGANFTQISRGDGTATGLPAGIVYDLFGDPNLPSRLYLVNGGAAAHGGVNGVFQSNDTGATWTKISDTAMEAVLAMNPQTVEIAVGKAGGIAVGVCQAGALSALFHSSDDGVNWASLDVPNIHPGGQAGIHFSIGVDPTNPNLVYVGGDRQETAIGWIGNSLLSGNLMRCDASIASGSQCVHLTHRSDLGPAGGGTGRSSAPHADSRDIAFDADGDLIQTDDGGIYRRTFPQDNRGDWYSILGNIQGTERHSIAYDSNSNIIVGGAQDNGTAYQISTGSLSNRTFRMGLGGDVAVDDFSTPGLSSRWLSSQSLYGTAILIFDTNSTAIGAQVPALRVISGPDIEPAFITPVEMNSVNPDRLLLLANNGLYESADDGNTLTQLSLAIVHTDLGTDPIAFGATDNPEVIYAGSGEQLWVRMTAFPDAPVQSTAYPGGGSNVRDIAIHPHLANTAWVTSSFNVYMTTDGGATWNDLTGNLDSSNGNLIRSLVYIHDNTNAGIVVGTQTGTFIARQADGFRVWHELGYLPKVAVFDLDYDLADDLLVAGTLGRGDWTLTNPLQPPCSEPSVPTSLTATAGQSISLSWSGSAPGYDVFRATGRCDSGSFTQVASNINTTSFTDDTVTPGTLYAYQVRGTVGSSGRCISGLTACIQTMSCGNYATLYPEWGTALNVLDFVSCTPNL